MECARDDLCKNLLILPESRWHPSVTPGHRMRDQERLALCLALLLSPVLILCHLSALGLFLCLSFPICRSGHQSCCV